MSDNYWNIVNAVSAYMARNNGRRPTIQEIGNMVDIKSTSHILHHLNKAVMNGDLIKEGEKGQARQYASKVS
jgi:hypothetical protein